MNQVTARKKDKIKTVCFGGGTGLPSLLRGLKVSQRLKITAVVNMFDSGGSSGELRDKFGILPPGDILKCLLALAEDDASARKILLKRIKHALHPGHTGGNVLLMGLEKVYGNYLDAVAALGQILAVMGDVVPVTLAQSTLCARYKDGRISKNETNVDFGIREGGEVEELFLNPRVEVSAVAKKAIEQADVICVGPGSFYTSVVSNFLPRGVAETIVESKAPIIFICNLLTEGVGMRDYTVEKIVNILEKQVGRRVDAVVVNTKMPDNKILERYAEEKKHPLFPDVARFGALDKRIIPEDLWLEPGIARHDSDRLAKVVLAAINQLVSD